MGFTKSKRSVLAPGTILTGMLNESVTDNITAFAGGGQSSAVLLTAELNKITTVATAGDSVKLPVTQGNIAAGLGAPGAGLTVYVINKGANACQVYGSGTDTIDDQATATGVSQMPNSLVLYSCVTPGVWHSEGLATGWGGPGLQTVSNTTGITAFAGGGQSSATALTGMVNRISTVATAGDSVRLPASAAGLQIVIDNRGANPCQVFGAGTDTINGIATATGISQGVNTIVTYTCTVAGNWEVPLAGSQPVGFATLGASGAVPPHTSHTYIITKAGVAALTLAAPTATTDDGVVISFLSATANAHTVTATGLLQTGSASVNVATFAAQPGAGVSLVAYQGKWLVEYSTGITFS